MTARSPLRVMVFIHSLHGGGAERVAADLTAHWAQAGCAVMLVTQADDHDDVYTLDAAVERRVLGTAGLSGGGWRGIWANLVRVRRLRAHIRAFRPDVVLGMMTTASVLAVLAARGQACAVVATEHTHPPSQSLSRMWQWLRRYTYPRADRVVALTQGTADWLADHVPGSQLAVIPNPVHWPLHRGAPEREVLHEPGKRYALAVGRLHPDKGFDVLVQAFAQIAPAHSDWDLIILGDGTAPQREALAAQIDAAGLGARIHLPGRAGNVGDWYAGAAFYVLSSRFEGLSNTLLEAMASGRPAVSFDCDTGPREIVREGVDGVLVRPAGSAHALGEAMAMMMADDALRQRLGARAVDVRERFSPEYVLGLWDTTFDAVRRDQSCAE